MGFVRFVFLIPWMTLVACVHMKHYTLRFAAPFPRLGFAPATHYQLVKI